MPNNKAMRTAVIRVSGVNIINQDNDILGVKAGDEVRYTKEMILDVLNDWTKTKYIDIHADENKTQEFISQLADI